MTDSLRQLFPASRELDAWEAYGHLDLKKLAPPDRPHVVGNMVTTVDGDATVAGRAKGISSDLDRELFHVLRTQVDAVMVGTNTIRVENYGPLVSNSKRRAHRESLGLEAEPVAVTVTLTMDLPVDAPLISDPGCRVIVITNSDLPVPDGAKNVEVIRTPGPKIDLAAALGELRGAHDIETILLEGGPTLLGAMISDALVDELFLTISPLIGSDTGGPKIVEGPTLPEPVSLELHSLLSGADSLFARYALKF